MVKWTPEDMEAAVNAVNDGEMTMRKAAFTFGIPKSTLATHVGSNDLGKVGKPTVLGWEEELLLVTLIIFMSDIGFGLCKLQIIQIVQYYYVSNIINIRM